MIPTIILNLLRSKGFWKLSFVMIITISIGIFILRYETLAKENLRLKSDLEDTEQELLLTLEESRKYQQLVESNMKEKTYLKKRLDENIKLVRKLREETNEKFRSCLDMPIPDDIFNGLFKNNQTQ